MTSNVNPLVSMRPAFGSQSHRACAAYPKHLNGYVDEVKTPNVKDSNTRKCSGNLTKK
uniref:Uncharacterized protein n=1 Tax=Candidatus Kentrum sp. TC TaxID=2126339 RepID=A0A450YLH2_9GAMM|nr:MAG: hypothetical protein BECKTC1821E_GA0114239_101849 [Candidatus Kentron sp. TC]